MSQFNATIGRLHLEVVYSEIERWISWNCVIRRADQLLGSLGGTAALGEQQSVQEAVEQAVGVAIRAAYPLG
ncbi:MAG TPA: hypothetical protein VL997_07395 [Dyella sp.]|nr:hypothetical protein [Dyella sp.]